MCISLLFLPVAGLPSVSTSSSVWLFIAFRCSSCRLQYAPWVSNSTRLLSSLCLPGNFNCPFLILTVVISFKSSLLLTFSVHGFSTSFCITWFLTQFFFLSAYADGLFSINDSNYLCISEINCRNSSNSSFVVPYQIFFYVSCSFKICTMMTLHNFPSIITLILTILLCPCSSILLHKYVRYFSLPFFFQYIPWLSNYTKSLSTLCETVRSTSIWLLVHPI